MCAFFLLAKFSKMIKPYEPTAGLHHPTTAKSSAPASAYNFSTNWTSWDSRRGREGDFYYQPPVAGVGYELRPEYAIFQKFLRGCDVDIDSQPNWKYDSGRVLTGAQNPF